MSAASPGEAIAAAVRMFIDCLPQPLVYARDASSRRLHRIAAPRARLVVVALDHHGPAALACIERIAARAGVDAIALSKHAVMPDRLRFDIVLCRRARPATLMNYAFREAAGGGLLTPVGFGPLVRLDDAGLTAGDELYFMTPRGKLAAIDRAASGRTTQLIEST